MPTKLTLLVFVPTAIIYCLHLLRALPPQCSKLSMTNEQSESLKDEALKLSSNRKRKGKDVRGNCKTSEKLVRRRGFLVSRHFLGKPIWRGFVCPNVHRWMILHSVDRAFKRFSWYSWPQWLLNSQEVRSALFRKLQICILWNDFRVVRHGIQLVSLLIWRRFLKNFSPQEWFLNKK